MTNKKVIVIVLVFLIGGLLVYSFAATPSQNLKDNDTPSDYENNDPIEDDNKTNEETENEELENLKKNLENLRKELEAARESGKYTDESLTEKEKLINIANNATTKEEYEKAIEDYESVELVEKEESNNNGTTTPINNPSNGNTQTTRPSGSGNQGTAVKPSTPSSGNSQSSNSGSNKPSTGNNQDSTGNNQSGNQETTDKPVVINKDELNKLQSQLDSDKVSGKYTDGSIAKKQELINIANSKTNKSDYDKALNDVKNFKLIDKSELIVLQTELNNEKSTNLYTNASINKKQQLIDEANNKTTISEYEAVLKIIQETELVFAPIGISNVSGSSNYETVAIEQIGTKINFTGNLSLNNNDSALFTVVIKAPKSLPDELLRNAWFQTQKNKFGFLTMKQEVYSILDYDNGIPYFQIQYEIQGRELKYDTPLNIKVDWGNNEQVEYSIYFNSIELK